MPERYYRRAAVGLRELTQLRRVILQKNTADLDVYFGQLPVLEYIAAHEGCTQAQVAEQMLVTPASIALTTKRLQKMGLLEKAVDEENLRCKRLSLTERGREMTARCRAVHDAFSRRMFEGFTEEELAQFTAALERMLCNITGQPVPLDEGAPTLKALSDLVRRRDLLTLQPEQAISPEREGADI